MPTKSSIKERRQFGRATWPVDVTISLLEPQGLDLVDHVNVSEAGLCLRLPANLEVKSLVRFQLTPNRNRLGKFRPMECTGRVAWVTQRLDLRNVPPYLFDIGIEFVNPTPVLSRLLSLHEEVRGERHLAAVSVPKKLVGADIGGRCFVPRITRDGGKSTPWHLVVSVDDSPCFSHHFATEHAAYEAWTQFQRQQARLKRASR